MGRKLIPPTVPAQTRHKKEKPPYTTHAENYYYLKQMRNKTPMIIVFLDGEVVKGRIEWYDDKVIKVHRDKEPNLLIFKHAIKYILKDEGALNK